MAQSITDAGSSESWPAGTCTQTERVVPGYAMLSSIVNRSMRPGTTPGEENESGP
ncbi:hypothetical protein [Microbacterium sp. 69-10]|uniref:hypothetical protein n=1 Tax=Microbacterium sp. 69-10 TaxID=1895783 RepID=UPI0025E29FFD|nr:hypothetical protein [Microbacterium sp. 69-10]